jgi:hypothetical protein
MLRLLQDPTPVSLESKNALQIASEAIVEVIPIPTPTLETKKPEEISVMPEEAEKCSYLEDSSPSLSSIVNQKPQIDCLSSYAYSESQSPRTNLKFFIKHALHEAADFVFILNGETDISEQAEYSICEEGERLL